MSDFKGRHFGGEIVLWAMRWYCRYPISYRDLETMMTERGVAVDHSTIYRWVQRFAPGMEKRLRWQWHRLQSRSWRIDETYVKVRGKWAYLYRAVDRLGNTIDFYLSSIRNTKAAKRFFGKALRGMKDWELPEVLDTDKAPTYAGAIAALKAEGKCPKDTRHQQVKYLNNVVEADHGKLKLLIRPVRGFKTLKTAYATIKGFEVMRALRKGQAGLFALHDGIIGEARLVERAFGQVKPRNRRIEARTAPNVGRHHRRAERLRRTRAAACLGHPHVHLAQTGENLALGKVAVANHPLAPVGQLLLDERRQVLLELRRDRDLDQPPRPRPKKLREGIRNPCWRPQRNHSIVAHVRCAPLAETVTFQSRFQQRHAARLNSSVHHFRP